MLGKLLPRCPTFGGLGPGISPSSIIPRTTTLSTRPAVDPTMGPDPAVTFGVGAHTVCIALWHPNKQALDCTSSGPNLEPKWLRSDCILTRLVSMEKLVEASALRPMQVHPELMGSSGKLRGQGLVSRVLGRKPCKDEGGPLHPVVAEKETAPAVIRALTV